MVFTIFVSIRVVQMMIIVSSYHCSGDNVIGQFFNKFLNSLFVIYKYLK